MVKSSELKHKLGVLNRNISNTLHLKKNSAKLLKLVKTLLHFSLRQTEVEKLLFCLRCWHSNIQETKCSIDLNNKKVSSALGSHFQAKHVFDIKQKRWVK